MSREVIPHAIVARRGLKTSLIYKLMSTPTYIDSDRSYIDFRLTPPYISGHWNSVIVYNNKFRLQNYIIRDVLEYLLNWLLCVDIANLAATCRFIRDMICVIRSRSNRRRVCLCPFQYVRKLLRNDGPASAELDPPPKRLPFGNDRDSHKNKRISGESLFYIPFGANNRRPNYGSIRINIESGGNITNSEDSIPERMYMKLLTDFLLNNWK